MADKIFTFKVTIESGTTMSRNALRRRVADAVIDILKSPSVVEVED